MADRPGRGGPMRRAPRRRRRRASFHTSRDRKSPERAPHRPRAGARGATGEDGGETRGDDQDARVGVQGEGIT